MTTAFQKCAIAVREAGSHVYRATAIGSLQTKRAISGRPEIRARREDYYPRISFASFGTAPIRATYLDSARNDADRELLSRAFDRTVVSRIASTDPHVVIIDALEERRPLAVFPDGGVVSESAEFQALGIDASHYRLVNLDTEEYFDLWQRGWRAFVEEIEEFGLQSRLVVHRAFVPPAPGSPSGNGSNTTNRRMMRLYTEMEGAGAAVRHFEVPAGSRIARSPGASGVGSLALNEEASGYVWEAVKSHLHQLWGAPHHLTAGTPGDLALPHSSSSLDPQAQVGEQLEDISPKSGRPILLWVDNDSSGDGREASVQVTLRRPVERNGDPSIRVAWNPGPADSEDDRIGLLADLASVRISSDCGPGRDYVIVGGGAGGHVALAMAAAMEGVIGVFVWGLPTLVTDGLRSLVDRSETAEQERTPKVIILQNGEDPSVRSKLAALSHAGIGRQGGPLVYHLGDNVVLRIATWGAVQSDLPPRVSSGVAASFGKDADLDDVLGCLSQYIDGGASCPEQSLNANAHVEAEVRPVSHPSQAFGVVEGDGSRHRAEGTAPHRDLAGIGVWMSSLKDEGAGISRLTWRVQTGPGVKPPSIFSLRHLREGDLLYEVERVQPPLIVPTAKPGESWEVDFADPGSKKIVTVSVDDSGRATSVRLTPRSRFPQVRSRN